MIGASFFREQLVRSAPGRILPFCLLAAIGLGCSPPPDEQVTGELGLFYGGQIQQREVVQLGKGALPTFGFRIVFPSASSKAHRIEWEVVRPGPAARRVTELGSVDLPPGRLRLDHKIPLNQGGAFGTWNVRVTVDDQLVIDRATLFRE